MKFYAAVESHKAQWCMLSASLSLDTVVKMMEEYIAGNGGGRDAWLIISSPCEGEHQIYIHRDSQDAGVNNHDASLYWDVTVVERELDE